MLIKCQVARVIHSNENFQLVGCIPIGDFEGISIHPVYHTFTVKDTSHRLTPNKNYTLDIKELPATKYGVSYLLQDIPSLSFERVDDITDDMELELLEEIMNESQAKNVHKAYPNFIRLIMSDRIDEIDHRNIRNVSDHRLSLYIKKVGQKYNAFLLHANAKEYELTQQECNVLLGACDDFDEAVNLIKEHPYYVLISICGRGFRRSDVMILNHNMDFKYSKERIEYMLIYAIDQFEVDGSTYVDAIRIGDYIASIDSDVLPQIKDIAIESDNIHYDEEKNILQKMSTYKYEKYIAEFFNRILNQSNNTNLDWDWSKYTTIKDGELTEEQQQLLKEFCNHRVVLLDAPSGTGKTSSLMALIQMIEENDLSYAMMSPTGKAASRLSEQTGRQASTIHRACLGNTLYDKDVIIIDECSMLSVSLMYMVITSDLLPTCRFVLVGDSAQIPSIGLGRVFRDMGDSGIIPKITLTKCFRFEEGGASYISTLTRQGEFYITDEQLKQNRFTLGTKEDYEFIRFNGKVEQIVDVYMSLIDGGVSPEDIMLLVPYNIGAFGATKLNNLIQEKINPLGDDLFLKTKHNDTDVYIHKDDLIMNIKNNYNAISLQSYDNIANEELLDISDAEKTSVFNGQTGYVKSVTNEHGAINGKMLVANIEHGEDIVYTSGDVNNLLLAYASNPYKFQGSQCKYIINVVIGAHERVWNRNLLYTAQTRITDKLIEIGDPLVIKEAVSQMGDDNRNTRLKEFLCLT